MHSYRVAGLIVGSEILLPGLIAAAGEDVHTPDVTIRLGSVPQTLECPQATGPTWQLAGSCFLLRIPDVARFFLAGGREIVVEPENGTGPRDIAIFLLGTVLGILLHQRGQIVLHASTVLVNGKAVLFCGASGAGKSTLAAALIQRGFSLVTDDLCVIAMAVDGTPLVQPDGRQMKLWAQSIKQLGLGEARGAPVRSCLQKFYVQPTSCFSTALPLGAVYMLREARLPHAPGIERPNVVDAALLLRRNAYRPQLVRRMGQKVDYFHAAAAIAGTAGIFHLTREFNFAQMPNVISWLQAHWAETGLAKEAA